jgi:hypothetical protein
MAISGNSARPAMRPKGAAPALIGGGDRLLLHNLLLDLVFIPDDCLYAFRLVQWNPAPIAAAAPAAAGDSSGSSSRPYSSRSSSENSHYSDRDARRFREERDATRHELEIISNRPGSPNSSGSISASSCSRPLSVSPETCLILIQS